MTRMPGKHFLSQAEATAISIALQAQGITISWQQIQQWFDIQIQIQIAILIAIGAGAGGYPKHAPPMDQHDEAQLVIMAGIVDGVQTTQAEFANWASMDPNRQIGCLINIALVLIAASP